jgi:hypothetical protein
VKLWQKKGSIVFEHTLIYFVGNVLHQRDDPRWTACTANPVKFRSTGEQSRYCFACAPPEEFFHPERACSQFLLLYPKQIIQRLLQTMANGEAQF